MGSLCESLKIKFFCYKNAYFDEFLNDLKCKTNELTLPVIISDNLKLSLWFCDVLEIVVVVE